MQGSKDAVVLESGSAFNYYLGLPSSGWVGSPRSTFGEAQASKELNLDGLIQAKILIRLSLWPQKFIVLNQSTNQVISLRFSCRSPNFSLTYRHSYDSLRGVYVFMCGLKSLNVQ